MNVGTFKYDTRRECGKSTRLWLTLIGSSFVSSQSGVPAVTRHRRALPRTSPPESWTCSRRVPCLAGPFPRVSVRCSALAAQEAPFSGRGFAEGRFGSPVGYAWREQHQPAEHAQVVTAQVRKWRSRDSRFVLTGAEPRKSVCNRTDICPCHPLREKLLKLVSFGAPDLKTNVEKDER